MDGLILVDRSGPVARITLNRPDAFNALNAELRGAILKAVLQVEADPAVRAVILSGAGKGFCSGADLNDLPVEPIQILIEQEYGPIFSGIAGSNKIWIAQIHGAAAGIGAALALHCDYVVMAEDASIYLAFGAVGLVPDDGLCWIIHRACGYRQALQAIIEQRRIGAVESVRLGLANAMFPETSLAAETHRLAEVISVSAPLAVAAAKRLLRRMDSISLSEAVFAEAVEQTALVRSADCAEGAAAFRERRRPVFRGA